MSGMQLDGKVAMVTGAAAGMGAVMAESLAGAGARVVAVDVGADGLAALAGRGGGRIVPITADLSDRSVCEALVARALAEAGALHVLVNNAGVGMTVIDPDYAVRPVRFWETDADRWQLLMNVNLRAAFLLAKDAARHFLAQGWGRIVNVTTSLDTMIAPTLSAYGQSKAALEAASASWAGELAGSGVTVNVLVPGGPVNTAFLPPNTTMPRDRLIQPEIMGPPIRWLASEEADGFTNRRIVARDWDASLPPAEAAAKASAPAAWAGFGKRAAMPEEG